MPEHHPPGVHIDGVTAGPRPIEAVDTRTGGMVGVTRRGPVGAPQLVTSFDAFEQVHGGLLDDRIVPGGHHLLPYAVRGFFENGGDRLYVSRIVGPGATRASLDLDRPVGAVEAGTAATPLFRLHARSRGSWGNDLEVHVSASSLLEGSVTEGPIPVGGRFVTLDAVSGLCEGSVLEFLRSGAPLTRARVSSVDPAIPGVVLDAVLDVQLELGDTFHSLEFDLTVNLVDDGQSAGSETFRRLAPDPAHDRYGPAVVGAFDAASERASNDGDSRLVVMSDRTFAPDGTPEADAGTRRMGIPAEGTALALTGGADDFAGIDDAVVVGDTAADPDDRSGIQSFLNHEDIDLVAAPGRTSATVQAALVAHCERMRHRFAVLETPQAADVAGAHLHRQSFDTDHGAIFHPWLLVPDPFGAAGALRRVPPSGHVMGIYARSDREHGVWKAPANEIVRGIHALERDVTAADQDVLNPAHVNCIRDFRSAGRGIRLWGARTLSSDPEWKYVNVRRLVMFLEHSIGKGTEWAVFEPNAQPLWTAVEGAITTFLSSIWRSGGLNGATQRDAFFVKVGPNVTMTQHDIDEGRLVVEVGVAPLKPAEFVIFRIVQKTADAAD